MAKDVKYSPGFERVLEYAAYDCAQRGATVVEVDHLLMGLYREDFPLIDGVLAAFQVDSLVVLDRLLKAHPEAPRPSRPDDVQLSPEALRAIAFGETEAVALGHHTVDVPHTLLGILRFHRDRLGRYFIREAIFKNREEQVLARVRELVAWFRFGAGPGSEVEQLDANTVAAYEPLPMALAPAADDAYQRFAVRLRILKRFRSER